MPNLPRTPKQVLVVDDAPANLALLLDTLTQAGHRVLVAENGQDALSILERTSVDLILLDLVMPGMDGVTVCATIRRNPAWIGIPILFMTSADAPIDKINAFAAGAIDYLVKPVYPPEVLARVAAQLELRALRLELEERNALLQSEVDLRIEAENELAATLDRAVIVAARDGSILFSTKLAVHLITKYFPAQRHDRLPAALPAGESSVSRGTDNLRIRQFRERTSTDFLVFYLEEENAPPGPLSLVKLGVTVRQAEVLYWIAQGKANGDIAGILGTSTRTIHKHVERIFERLGVENRMSAMLAANEVLRPAR